MSLVVTHHTADPAQLATPLLVVPILKAEPPVVPATLSAEVAAALGRAIEAGDVTGGRDEAVLLHAAGAIPRVLAIGLGDKPTASALRRAAMVAGKRARTIGVPSASFLLPDAIMTAIGAERAGQAVAEGLPFGAWQFTALKRPADKPKPLFAECAVVTTSPSDAVASGIVRGAGVAAGQAFTRHLQVLPANTCTPAFLAERATEMASRHGFRISVLDRTALEREGMHAILAVGQGSDNEPRFIELEYAPEGMADAPPVVLIGKGVTFDTGGISIKPAQAMEEMKYDMSGAAAVLGTFEMLGQLRPKVRVIGLVPSAENMVAGNAYRPGDVVGSHFGKTIEVLNTDAEGRLLLADALSWARRFHPAAVVDCATLTGAVVIGLGHTASAVLGTDPELIHALQVAGEASGERLWELPLWDEYRELIKSDIADMKNTGGRPAGTITAAWFLGEFVEGFPWAHVDIAGTAYTDRELPTQVKGPTGMLVRCFAEFLFARSN
jgi:leucyl aminopeptidase